MDRLPGQGALDTGGNTGLRGARAPPPPGGGPGGAQRLGRIDVLVNNAGIQKAGAVTETPLEDWERMMAVHLRGAFLCCREVAPHMIARQSGRIILLTSQLAYIGRERAGEREEPALGAARRPRELG